MNKGAGLFLIPLVGLNLLPVYGVLSWHWQTLDLIVLYWLENVVIGVFMIVRFLVHKYDHPAEAVGYLFFAAFFTVHYGMFCSVHGIFVFSLFGADQYDPSELYDPYLIAFSLMKDPTFLAAFIALFMLQFFDWLREGLENNFEAADSKEITAAPYRRIVVLHVAILASGFVLAALNEPIGGLVLLVFIKIGFDYKHWKDDERKAGKGKGGQFELTAEMIQEMDEKFPGPKFEVNGREMTFDSYQDLKNSKEFKLMKSVMRFAGGGKEFKKINAYLDYKIKNETAERSA